VLCRAGIVTREWIYRWNHTRVSSTETGVNIRWSRFTNMSALISRLTDLPTEILEEILLHLPGQDIVKLEAVRCIVVIQDDSALTLTLCCTV